MKRWIEARTLTAEHAGSERERGKERDSGGHATTSTSTSTSKRGLKKKAMATPRDHGVPLYKSLSRSLQTKARTKSSCRPWNGLRRAASKDAVDSNLTGGGMAR
jgi:hypothetical protein